MKVEDFNDLLSKYQSKYGRKLEIFKEKYYQTIVEYDKEQFKSIIHKHGEFIKQLLCEIIKDFTDLNELKGEFCVMLNGSYARKTNVFYSDIDINYFYAGQKFEEIIKIEEKINYIIQKVLGFRGRDRIHSMVVHMPLISNKKYDFIGNNMYPLYFEDGVIYNTCRENADQLMYETFNSTRNINDVVAYLNEFDNENMNNEWTNCLEMLFDKGLYDKFAEKRNIYKGTKKFIKHIDDCLNSISVDDIYFNYNSQELSVKYVKYYYKILPLTNFYQIVSLIFRKTNLTILQMNDMEEEISEKQLFDCFYKHLNNILRLQYLLDMENMDLSCHSSKSLNVVEIDKKYFEEIGAKNIIEELNDSKYNLYQECVNLLNSEKKIFEGVSYYGNNERYYDNNYANKAI